MNKRTVEKNILDLQFTKHVQEQNTLIMILYTYLIGLGIIFLTEQASYSNISHIFITATITIMVFMVLINWIMHTKRKQQEIMRKIVMLTH